MNKEFNLLLNNPRKSLIWPSYDTFCRRSLLALNLYLSAPVSLTYIWFGIIPILTWHLYQEVLHLTLITRIQYYLMFGFMSCLTAISIVLLSTIFSYSIYLSASAFELMSRIINVTERLLDSVQIGWHSLFRVNLFLRRYCNFVHLLFDVNKVCYELVKYLVLINFL